MGIFEASVFLEFSAAHHLLNYEGNCARMHGHNWKVEITARGPKLDKSGILIDFRFLRAEGKRVIEQFDHQVINDVAAFEGLSPSAENLAQFIGEKVNAALTIPDVKIHSVRIWENDRSVATYYL